MYIHILRSALLTGRQVSIYFDARLLHPLVPHNLSRALSAVLKGIRSLMLVGNTENPLAQASFGPSNSMVAMSHGVIYV